VSGRDGRISPLEGAGYCSSSLFSSVRSGWIGLVLVSIYDRVEEKTGHVHVLF
jgi:hypothetical protein